MPKLTTSTPKYRKHRASGQAVCTIGGKDFYLGPHGTKASRLEYDRLITEWLAAGRPVQHPSVMEPAQFTVKELINEYQKWAKQYYRRGGESTGTAERLIPVLRLVKQSYGDKLVLEFGPLSLEALQSKMIDVGHSRQYINMNTSRIKRMFRWGVRKELVPVEVLQRLETVGGLAKDRTQARETAPVEPVADDVVDATLPHLPPVVRDMVQFQRLTGARPGEVFILRPCNVDRSGDVWRYVPGSHKTEHQGRGRVIFIGPRAQAILTPYLLRESTAFCFSPKDSERRRLDALHQDRKTPLSCGNRPGTNRKRKPKRTAGERYDKNSYRQAIHRACVKAGVENWSPNRLRHAAATGIRKQYGLEAAQVVLGHAKADTTQIYAERDLAKAVEVMREVG